MNKAALVTIGLFLATVGLILVLDGAALGQEPSRVLTAPAIDPDWKVFAKQHPKFARAYVLQQLNLWAVIAALHESEGRPLPRGVQVRLERDFCESVKLGTQLVAVPAEFCFSLNLPQGPGSGCLEALNRCLHHNPDDPGPCYDSYLRCLPRLPR